MPCLYPFYVETFFAAGAALQRNDEEWLASIRAGAEALDGEHACVAALALSDASSGAPLRARARLCPDFVSEECTVGRCQQLHGAVHLAR